MTRTLAALPIALAVLALAPGAQTFSAAPSVGGANREAVVPADFDGDGDLDFATGGGNVSVFWSAGDLTGSFVSIPITIQPNADGGLTAGDVDSDGDMDIVVANGVGAPIQGAPGILLHRNAGSQTFTQTLTVTTPKFGSADPRLGDVDGDGDLDLFLQFSAAGTLEVWTNDGTGAFAVDLSYAIAGSSVQDLALADVDGDGDLDLATGQFNAPDPGTVRLRLNDGTGSFGPETGFLAGGLEANDLEFADVDSDGDLDLVLTRPDLDDVALFLNAGGGSFGAPSSIFSGTDPWRTTGADLNDDGFLDLALTRATGPGSLEVLLGDGTGSFSTPESYSVGNLPFEFGALDLDLDGDLELVVQNSGDFSVFENLTDPTITADTLTLSLSDGGTHALELRAGPSSSGSVFWVLGSATGRSPGLDFGGGVILPLNFDGYMKLTLNKPGLGAFSGFRGVLDADGRASAALVFPPGVDPGLAGVTLHHAYLVAAVLGVVDFASDAIAVRLVP